MTIALRAGDHASTCGSAACRLLSVVLATLIAPAILAVHQVTGVNIDVWAVIIGSVVMFLLVVIRMNLAIEQIAAAHRALEVLQDELAVQATHDPLTGLANRTQAMRLLAGALGRARRGGNVVGLLVPRPRRLQGRSTTPTATGRRRGAPRGRPADGAAGP